MILDELIDLCQRIRTVHGGHIGVVVKRVEIDPPDCECRHYMRGEERTINAEVERVDCIVEERGSMPRKVVIR